MAGPSRSGASKLRRAMGVDIYGVMVGFPVEVAGNGSQQFLEEPSNPHPIFFSSESDSEAIQSAVLSPPAGS